ncbi:uncharacterized protein LOC144343816 [Saccoglossus kowalevskii]
MMKYIVVLLTRKDQLEDDGISLDEYLSEVPQFLSDILEKCDHRVIAFNNKSKDVQINWRQTTDLLKIIEKMKAKNGYKPFTNNLTDRVKKVVEEDRMKN